MKIGGFILALLVTFLSAIPCCSFDECGDEIVSEEHHQEGANNMEDSCSPFLNCGNCAGFTSQTIQEENYTTYISVSGKPVAHYQYRTTGAVINNIWQPPRLFF